LYNTKSPEFRPRGESRKETSKGLPVVKSGKVESMWENFTERENWGEHLEEVKERTVNENPELVKFWESQVGKYPPELHAPMFELLVSNIAVLEHQAEANKFDSMFGDPEPDK
jgi:hypothetical protein